MKMCYFQRYFLSLPKPNVQKLKMGRLSGNYDDNSDNKQVKFCAILLHLQVQILF